MRGIVPHRPTGLTAPGLHPFGWDVESLFNQVFGEPHGEPRGEAGTTPTVALPMELRETEQAIVVRAEVAGIGPSELVVELDDDVLTLSGEKTEEKTSDQKGRHYSERRYGRFRRSIQLPATVDAESVKATHANGVVTVTLQKAAANRSRRIQIETT